MIINIYLTIYKKNKIIDSVKLNALYILIYVYNEKQAHNIFALALYQILYSLLWKKKTLGLNLVALNNRIEVIVDLF